MVFIDIICNKMKKMIKSFLDMGKYFIGELSYKKQAASYQTFQIIQVFIKIVILSLTICGFCINNLIDSARLRGRFINDNQAKDSL